MSDFDYQYPFMQQGWECPKCGRIYSPTTPMCMFCGAEQKTSTTTGYTFSVGSTDTFFTDTKEKNNE